MGSIKELVIDGACGIGAQKIDTFRKIFDKLKAEGTTYGLPSLRTVNFPGEGPLNENCGAEFVQKQQLPPKLYSPASRLTGLSKGYMTSFDVMHIEWCFISKMLKESFTCWTEIDCSLGI